jgi:hypothetical protein
VSLVRVNDYGCPGGWSRGLDGAAQARHYCEQLEAERVLLFKSAPFDLAETDREFLLAQRQTDSRYHKNVSYKPRQDALGGYSGGGKEDGERMHRVMRHFSTEVTRFLSEFLAPYAPSWKLDYASFRPLEEKGRELPLHKRNDLLHVDAFPTRPTQGGRILRVFINIHPSRPRNWITTADGFSAIASRYAKGAGLAEIARQSASPLRTLARPLAPLAKALGMPQLGRSGYDRFMLRFHDYLKEQELFQARCAKQHLAFPPGSVWMVFTDAVPHAALSGQFAMEQTYIVPLAAMVTPDRAPIRVLERLCGRPLASPGRGAAPALRPAFGGATG